MSKLPICEAADFINGRAFKPSEWGTKGLPIIRIQNLTGTNEAFNFFNGTVDPKNVVKRGDILISWSASLGVYRWTRNDAALNQHIFKVVLKPGVVSSYFYYVATNALNQMVAQVHGSTMQHITKDKFDAIPIFLPTETEQKRIAAILEKADRLRSTRRYARQLSDTFLQSVFLQIFGDPLQNSRNWNIEPLGEKLLFLTSGSRGWAKYYRKNGDLFLRIQNVGKNQLLLDDLAFVQPPRNAEGSRTVVQAGDVLLTITADLGRSAVVPKGLPRAYINQHLALLRFRNVDPTFAAALLSSNAAKRQWDSLDRSAVKSGLNFDDIRGFKMISPPLPLQQRFAAIVRRFERLRAQQGEAARQAEHLFQTLLHRAFAAA